MTNFATFTFKFGPSFKYFLLEVDLGGLGGWGEGEIDSLAHRPVLGLKRFQLVIGFAFFFLWELLAACRKFSSRSRLAAGNRSSSAAVHRRLFLRRGNGSGMCARSRLVFGANEAQRRAAADTNGRTHFLVI